MQHSEKRNPATARTVNRASKSDQLGGEIDVNITEPDAISQWLQANYPTWRGPIIGELRNRFGLTLGEACKAFHRFQRSQRGG